MAGTEGFYDDEIAPLLLDVGKKCQENGLSMTALVEWEPGGRGVTATVQEDASLLFRTAHAAASPGANIDSLVFAAARYVREHKLPHTSIILQQAGVDPDPAKR